MKKFLFWALLSLGYTFSSFGITYKVSKESEFKSYLKIINPGDVIIIKNNTYRNWSDTITRSGTVDNPITIRAEGLNQVIFKGKVSKPVLKFSNARNIIISGFTFQDIYHSTPVVDMLKTSNCKLSKCRFQNDTGATQTVALIVIQGDGLARDNIIDGCTFLRNKDNVEIQVRINAGYCPRYTSVTNNTFTDKTETFAANGGECIQIGQDEQSLGDSMAYANISYNKFVRCTADPEVISNKSSGNTYLYNSFEDCGEGELVLRGGNSCIVKYNSFNRGKRAIRVNGNNHIVKHNNIDSTGYTGIRLLYGNTNGSYTAASNCKVDSNTITNVKGNGIVVAEKVSGTLVVPMANEVMANIYSNNSTNAVNNVNPINLSLSSPNSSIIYYQGSNIVMSIINTGAGSILKNVSYYVNNVKKGTSSSVPYSYTLSNVAAGIYNIKAIGTDYMGATQATTIFTLVVKPNLAPTISFTTIDNQSVIFSSSLVDFVVKTKVYDTDGSGTYGLDNVKVDYYINGNYLASDTYASSDHVFSWPVRANNLRPYPNVDTVKAVVTDKYEAKASTIIKIRKGINSAREGDSTNIVETDIHKSDVFPNPCTDRIELSLWEPGDIALLYDSKGNLVAEERGAVINTGDLAKGLYMLKHKDRTYKVIKE